MSNNDGQIGQKHVFTVLGAVDEPSEIVEVGDRQAWNPSEDFKTGVLVVTRGTAPVPYWDDKTFVADPSAKNQYVCTFPDGKNTTTITIFFERARHMTDHIPVWMIFGKNVTVGPDPGAGSGDPPRWGGQNKH